jgi:hypothetical protein
MELLENELTESYRKGIFSALPFHSNGFLSSFNVPIFSAITQLSGQRCLSRAEKFFSFFFSFFSLHKEVCFHASIDFDAT